ncbi:MAG: microcin C ABC transporter permease YejB [Pseudomonadales bacterium]|nr:microcin C ABC transporter permease YejB [Pseudomonadales bacterium]
MGAYIVRRLALVIPTLIGIMIINFAIIQAAPGGPVEQMIAKLQGLQTGAGAQIGGSQSSDSGSGSVSASPASNSVSDNKYQGSRGLPPDLILHIEKMYGFDQPAHKRFFIMLKNYAFFDFGNSFYRDRSVIDLIKEKLPVSISIGLWSTLIMYFISIPLGIRKAVKHGSHFDLYTSAVIIIGSSIPGFLFAIMLVIVFAGGNYLDWFPLRGLTSDNWEQLSSFQKMTDYLWHICLPITAIVIGSFATLTMLTKNSFLDEINKQYVITARAKGLTDQQVLYRHVFRNAMLIIVAGLPAAFVSIFFGSSLLIEYIFSLDGLGLLGFESAINRDYPVVFATLYIFTLMGLTLKLVGDVMYVIIDPRIDFDSKQF